MSTADLPHLADVVLSCVHFYKRASTAGSLECRGRPWSRVPPRPTQGQPPAVGEVEGTTTRQHCSSAAIWRSSPRADTHERPPAKRHHACLPASLGLNHTSFWADDSWIPNQWKRLPNAPVFAFPFWHSDSRDQSGVQEASQTHVMQHVRQCLTCTTKRCELGLCLTLSVYARAAVKPFSLRLPRRSLYVLFIE